MVVPENFAPPLCTDPSTSCPADSLCTVKVCPTSHLKQHQRCGANGVKRLKLPMFFFVCHSCPFSLVSVRKQKTLSPLVWLHDREQQGWQPFWNVHIVLHPVSSQLDQPHKKYNDCVCVCVCDFLTFLWWTHHTHSATCCWPTVSLDLVGYERECCLMGKAGSLSLCGGLFFSRVLVFSLFRLSHEGFNSTETQHLTWDKDLAGKRVGAVCGCTRIYSTEWNSDWNEMSFWVQDIKMLFCLHIIENKWKWFILGSNKHHIDSSQYEHECAQ